MALQSLSIRSKIDSKIRSNVITLKDIRTRKRFWIRPYKDPMRIGPGGNTYYVNRFGEKIEQPTDLQKRPYKNYDYIPLKICPRWFYWQEQYSFLPVPDYWETIIKRTVGSWNKNMTEQEDPDAELPLYKARVKAGLQKPKDPATIVPAWDTLENEDYYILASSENVMTVILQNRKQYDWIRPDCVFFFGRNAFSPDGLQWNKDKVEYEVEFYRRNNGGKDPEKYPPVSTADMPTMWWVRSWRYINTGNLFAEVILEKCYIWHYFGNWMNTWFNAKINRSLINMDHISYGGLPLSLNNEAGRPVSVKQHYYHWPMDEDWYVIREKNLHDETVSKVESNESSFPAIRVGKWIYNNIIKVGSNADPIPIKETPNNDYVTVKEGWMVDSSGKTVWGELPDGYILDESIAPSHHCPACDACFDFCGDLRIKKAMNPVLGPKRKKYVSVQDGLGNTRQVLKTDHSYFEGDWQEVPSSSSWQPGDGKYYKVMYTHFPQKMTDLVNPKANITASVICDEEGNTITAVPSNIQLIFWEPSDNVIETSNKIPSILFLVDYHHEYIKPERLKKIFPNISLDPYSHLYRGAMITSSARRSPTNMRKFHWDFLPQIFYHEPHLIVHSSAQFFFQYNLLFTANLKHLWVKRKSRGFALGYRVITRSSVAGILYMFESLDIFYKWELKVRGSIQNNSVINQVIANVQGKLLGAAKKAIGAAVDTGLDAMSGGLWSKAKSFLGFGGGSGDKVKEKQPDGSVKEVDPAASIAKSLQIMSGEGVEGATGKPMNGKEYGEQSGLGADPTNLNEDDSNKDAQTERKSKSTGKTKEKEVKPAIFYTNTIDFSYDFWEFANRCVADPFMVRFEYSEILYNNLANNNNAHPVQNYDVRGNRFCQVVKKGDFQAQVKLGFDPRGIFSGICAKGTTWYDEGTDWDLSGNIISDWWTPWIPQYRALQSYTLGAVFNTQTQQGGEDTTTTAGKRDRKKGLEVDPKQKDYGYVTYFRVSDSKLFELIRQQFGSAHNTKDHGGFDNKYVKNVLHENEAGGAFCWGCNHSFLRGKGSIVIKVPGGGQWIKGIFNRAHTATGPELDVGNIPTDPKTPWELEIQDNGTMWVTVETPGESETRYKADIIQALNVQNFASRENKEPVWTDRNMAGGSGIGSLESDKMPEIPDPEKEAREKQMDKPEPETRERGGDMEKDYQTERDKEQEKQKERENEREQQKEEEREKERQEETERQQEKEKQKEEQREKEKQMKERQKQDKERKEKAERLRRESKLRAEKAKKEKKRKEKKEREKE